MRTALASSRPGRLEWMTHPDRPCASRDPEDWFRVAVRPGPRSTKTDAHAAALCDGCPVLTECLGYALANPTLVGIWGGTTPQQRRDIRKERP